MHPCSYSFSFIFNAVSWRRGGVVVSALDSVQPEGRWLGATPAKEKLRAEKKAKRMRREDAHLV